MLRARLNIDDPRAKAPADGDDDDDDEEEADEDDGTLMCTHEDDASIADAFNMYPTVLRSADDEG